MHSLQSQTLHQGDIGAKHSRTLQAHTILASYGMLGHPSAELQKFSADVCFRSTHPSSMHLVGNTPEQSCQHRLQLQSPGQGSLCAEYLEPPWLVPNSASAVPSGHPQCTEPQDNLKYNHLSFSCLVRSYFVQRARDHTGSCPF